MAQKTPKKKTKLELTSRPRGMRDIIGDEFLKYQGFFEKSAEVATYYGFKPIQTPILEKEAVFTSSVGVSTDIVEKEMYTLKTKGGESLVMRPEGTASIMRAYITNGMHNKPQPVMFYYYGPFFRHEKPQKGRWREFYQFGLESLGTEKSIADALIIRATMIIIEEAGIKNLSVRLNSIGDKNCRPVYIKSLVAYYRKHINDMCANCRQRIKTNPLRLLDCNDKQCQTLKEEAPEMVGYLCEPCKKHFKEVLEYLDNIDVPYNIDHTLVRGIDYYTRTVFEVVKEQIVDEPTPDKDKKDDDGEAIEEKGTEKKKDDKKEKEHEKEEPKLLALAGGGRYDNLSKALGSKREVPGVGVGIGVDRILELDDFCACPPRIMKKPKVYFIQIGFEAKLKSLEIIELLRKAKIPIFQALSKDKLSIQLAIAEKMNTPHTIILGQKEVIDNTVIIRDMNSRSQKTVKIDKLVEFLKKG